MTNKEFKSKNIKMNLIKGEASLQLSPILACKIGVNEAIFLQQLHYWLLKSQHTYQGKKWMYNSLKEWNKNFPFWGERTLQRIIKSLKSKDLIEIKCLDSNPLNHTSWYSINYQNPILKETLKSISDDDKLASSKQRLQYKEQINIYRSSCHLTYLKKFDEIDLKSLSSEFLDNPISSQDSKLLKYGAYCVLKFLNTETNREYRPVDSNLKPITTKLKSGVTIRECWKIIRRKQKEWNGTDFEKYLRVSTLFKFKFEEYLAELHGYDRKLKKELLEKSKRT